MSESNKNTDRKVELDVLVTAFGQDGIWRLARPGFLQPTPGVRYVVSWQSGESDSADTPFPPELESRPDVELHRMSGVGVSRNRNNLLSLAQAPYILMADDDVKYHSTGLRTAIDTMNANPEVDIAVFRVKYNEPRKLPRKRQQLSYSGVSKTYFPYMVEVVMRRESIERVGLKFNELFGINAPFLGAGEEDVFLYEAWYRGLNLTFFPIDTFEHPEQSIHRRRTPDVMMARGAVAHVLHPRTAVFRLMRRAASESGFSAKRFSDNFRLMLKGRAYAIRHVKINHD
ncbi:MAG: glycosyltransferase [Muribaculaceae bacterium]|nr:glycosyltransferase [Muribaculaceae bacterium]